MNGKNAIITGGVRGIGLAIAREFCERGANVMLCYRNNDEAAEAAAAELAQFGTKVVLSKGDVADEAYAEAAVKKAVEELGGVDILINDAGITRDKLLARMTPEDFRSVIETNLIGAFNFTKYASAVMMKKRYGRIINMASIVGVRGNAGQANYAASKAGLVGMTLSNAKELGRRNITVNAVAPGFIKTDMTSKLTEEQKAEGIKLISLGRYGRAEEVAKLTAFLSSEDAAYITGQVIGIDGGMMM
ncbi:MAG: 3-oxoacyl-[acyl-carrier-protein] reductase [Anaerovoracaceae bacterium]